MDPTCLKIMGRLLGFSTLLCLWRVVFVREGGREYGGGRKEEGGKRKEEGGKRKEERGKRKEEGRRKKEEGRSRKEEGGRREEEGGRRKGRLADGRRVRRGYFFFSSANSQNFSTIIFFPVQTTAISILTAMLYLRMFKMYPRAVIVLGIVVTEINLIFYTIYAAWNSTEFSLLPLISL
jgi:hypothetical protein